MGKEENPRVPLDECVTGRLYKVSCRNFSYGVYIDKGEFIGVRRKFNSVFLDTEDHWETGPPYGTVHTIVDTGIDVPEGIELGSSEALFEWMQSYLGSI